MKKETLFVAFSSQKGGVGKSTFTVLTASYFHFVRGLSVGIVDCDSPQHSINLMRTRDLEKIKNDSYYKQLAVSQLRETNIKAYPIIKGSAENAIEVAQQMITSTQLDYDIIFFDLPGTVNSAGVFKTIAAMDYVFCPINADRVVMESSIAFMSLINEKLVKSDSFKLQGIYPFWNRVKASARTKLYTNYNAVMDKIGIQHLETSIPDSVKFGKELSDDVKGVFRSTFFPPNKKLIKGTNLVELFEEILSTLKLE